MAATAIVASDDTYTPPDLLDDPQDWRGLALCAQADPEVFFPEIGGNPRPAKRVCVACPVQWECANYALDFDEQYGVWGGLSSTARKRIRDRHLRLTPELLVELSQAKDRDTEDGNE